ncbi:MAG TPA: 50S ribosomal protein L24 [Candidatus Binataceae bacterium]|jgi:large subunit ribosomal protein L24|nr:50S ribosomal protein L24 [Candidatus Binataceae bacterium]
MPEQAKVRRTKQRPEAARTRIKKNDLVMVVTGRERGKTGKVMRVIADEGRVIVERLNVMKRHSKPRGPQSPGGIVEKEAAIPVSNVMFFCERCNAPVRIGVKAAADGTRIRICRRCGEQIGNE